VQPSKSPAGRIGLGVVVGVTIAALILIGGLGWVLTRSNNWSAKATAVVLPRPDIPAQTAAGYYDTLSRGQIIETYAEELRAKFPNAGDAGINLGTAGARQTTIVVAVVPNTALVTIEATSPNGPTAEAVADAVFTQGSDYIRSLAQPYVLNSVSAAKGTATQNTSHTGGFLAVLVVVAIVVGIAVQQAVSQLVNTRRKTAAGMPPVAAPTPAATVPTAPPFPAPGVSPTGPPAAPAPPAVRPTVPDRRQRQRWPAEPIDNDEPERGPENRKPEPAANGKPAEKAKSEPAGNGKTTPGRVEGRIPES